MQTASKPYTLKGVDYEFLLLVKEYHSITAAQIVRLRYKAGSLSSVQERLKNLFDAGFLLRRQLPHVGPGSSEYIYALSIKGYHKIEDLGYEIPSRVRKSEFEQKDLPHLEHLLGVNDILIAARLLPGLAPQITLQEFRHDMDLHKTPLVVSYDARSNAGKLEKERTTIIPDGWLDFRCTTPQGDTKRRCLVLELDRGTMDMKRVKQKLRAYTHCAVSEEYVTLFGTNIIMVVYLTTKKQRAIQLREWCEQELTLQQLTHDADLFRFAYLPETTLDPLTLFCKDICTIPFEKTPVSLLWQLPTEEKPV